MALFFHQTVVSKAILKLGSEAVRERSVSVSVRTYPH